MRVGIGIFLLTALIGCRGGPTRVDTVPPTHEAGEHLSVTEERKNGRTSDDAESAAAEERRAALQQIVSAHASVDTALDHLTTDIRRQEERLLGIIAETTTDQRQSLDELERVNKELEGLFTEEGR